MFVSTITFIDRSADFIHVCLFSTQFHLSSQYQSFILEAIFLEELKKAKVLLEIQVSGSRTVIDS